MWPLDSHFTTVNSDSRRARGPPLRRLFGILVAPDLLQTKLLIRNFIYRSKSSSFSRLLGFLTYKRRNWGNWELETCHEKSARYNSENLSQFSATEFSWALLNPGKPLDPQNLKTLVRRTFPTLWWPVTTPANQLSEDEEVLWGQKVSQNVVFLKALYCLKCYNSSSSSQWSITNL